MCRTKNKQTRTYGHGLLATCQGNCDLDNSFLWILITDMLSGRTESKSLVMSNENALLPLCLTHREQEAVNKDS